VRRRSASAAPPVLVLACLAAAAPADAQTRAAPTREQLTPQPRQDPDRRPPTLTTEGGVGQSPCTLADPAYVDIRFTLRRAEFANLRSLPAEALDAAWAPYVGTSQPLAAICAIRDSAAAMLRARGYIAAIEIPEQRIADGIVRFDVLMAKLVAVRVRGDAGRSERAIARILGKLTEKETFNRDDAERALLLAGDLPGFDVRLALQSAGGAPGEVIGEVTVRHLPAIVDLNLQNFGSRSLGRLGGLARAQFFGLTGLGDRTSLTIFSTADFDEQQTVQAAHEFRIGGDGLSFGGELTYSWAHPDLGLAGVDIGARTLLASAAARYPFVRRQRRNLWGALGFELIDQDVSFNRLPLTRDRLRIAFARIDLDATDRASVARAGGYSVEEPRWRLSGSLEARQGLGALGASKDCGPAFARCTGPGAVGLSRLEGEPAATVLRAAALAELRPDPDIALVVGARAQFAGKPLLAFEEYSAGNYTIGRGYDPGALLGDRGIGIQSELRLGSIVPRGPGRTAFQPFLFLDAAWVANEDRVFAAGGRNRLASAGGGVRVTMGTYARLEAAVAVPLVRAGLQADRGKPRLLVSLTTSLRPWSFR
jgi:hemolysin activation/secretion protein